MASVVVVRMTVPPDVSVRSGIGGVQVALAGHDVFNNTVARTATTDASGNYLIDNLEQSDATGYTLTESQPSGYSDGIETAGTAATGARHRAALFRRRSAPTPSAA